VTYGDVTSRLRDTMIWLLERRRITQQLGGPGSFRVPVTTTEADRMAMGEEIQRYRAAVLTYCLEAVRAVTPTADLEGKDRLRDPASALRHQLEVARAAMPADTRVSSLMMKRPHFELVSRWQEAARIAIEGEREIAAVRRQPLSREQQAQVLKDAADLVRGLVVLDIRYKNVPGWHFLEQKGRLITAATAVSERLDTPLDTSIDGLGWRPTPGRIQGPALPGLAGAVQAQHNVVVDLSQFPSASNLRHVLIAQADVSKQAARLAESTATSLVGRFTERAELYCELVRASRTVGGELGAGRDAALESSNAARRLRGGPVEGERVGEALERLAHLGDRVDARIATAVEHGFQEKLYFVAFTLPCLDTHARDGIFRPAQKWISVASTSQTELLALTRQRLRPVQPPVVTAPAVSAQGRAAYDAVLRLGRGNAPRCSPRR
jgi:hypothetical protein